MRQNDGGGNTSEHVEGPTSEYVGRCRGSEPAEAMSLKARMDTLIRAFIERAFKTITVKEETTRKPKVIGVWFRMD